MTRGLSSETTLQPNLRTDTNVGLSRQDCRLIREVVRVAHGLWPEKTAYHLSFKAGVDQRTAERWIALRTGISGDALAALIACEHGVKFIEAAIIAQGRGLPDFWKRFKQRQETSRLKKEMRQLQLRLEKVETDEDAE